MQCLRAQETNLSLSRPMIQERCARSGNTAKRSLITMLQQQGVLDVGMLNQLGEELLTENHTRGFDQLVPLQTCCELKFYAGEPW